jgi:hypothetical protein
MQTDSGQKPSAPGDSGFEEEVKQALVESDQQRVAQLQRAHAAGQQQQAALLLEASRLSAKYGNTSPQAARAKALAEVHGLAVEETKVMVQKAQTPVVEVADTMAVFFGRTIDRTNAPQCGFTVEARDANDRVLASAETDRDGSYRISIDAAKTSEGILASPDKAPPPRSVKLVVSKAGRIWLRNSESLPVEAGRAIYRELVLPTGGPCGDEAGPAA